MRTPPSAVGRFRTDSTAQMTAPPRAAGRTWPAMRRDGEIRQLAAPVREAEASLPTLRRSQHACYEALSLALREGHVFAALTGPAGSGKTVVLEAVLADRRDRALRCIRITEPDKVPASLANQIEQVAYAEAGKPENLERHVVLAVDDAHLASDELLLCLSRLAEMREPGRRVPQILLAGRPELWDRLATDDYEPLARRLAIRAALPAVEDDVDDPWATVEDEVAQTMARLRAEAANVPALADDYDEIAERERLFGTGYGYGRANTPAPAFDEEAEIPPPSVFALFPDPPPAAPAAPARSTARETRRRLLMPLVSLFVGLAAFAFALSFYDWPDLIGDLPWAESKPSEPFVMPISPQARSFGLPMPPSASAPAKPASPPRAAPPAPAASVPATPPAPAAPAPVASAPPPAAALPAPAPPVRLEPAEPVRPPAAEPAPTVAHAPPAPPAVPAAPVSAPPAAAPAVSAAPVPAPAAPRPRAAAEAPLSPALIALLLRRGDEQNAIGDISAARLLYERAAEAGSGVAARQLARTYDPAFLPPAVEATLADLARARQWYQRAAALGNVEAAARLKTLNGGH